VHWPDEIGVGNIMLTATGPDNTICIKEVCVELIERPIAGIISNPLHAGLDVDGNQYIDVCDGQEIQFFSNSTASADAPIVGYFWEAENDTWSTQNFTFTADYNVYGNGVMVVHSVVNECGCESKSIYIIRISKFPTLDVRCYGSVCENDQVTYTTDPTICNQFLWSAEGGDIISGQTTNEITVEWNDIDNGYGYLALDGDGCYEATCPYLTYLPIPVMSDEADIAGPEIVCTGDVVYFELPQWASTEYDWSLLPTTGVNILSSGHPHKLMVRFNAVGTYTLNANYLCEFLGCSGTANEKTIIVRKPFNIVSDAEACAGETVDFATDCGTSEVFTWTIFDGDMIPIYSPSGTANHISYTFNNAGSYTVFAENANYCRPAERSIIVHALPPIPQPDDSGWVTEVCPNSGYVFNAEPDDEQYYLHWEAICGTPQEFDGPEFNVTLGDPICDIQLFHIDKITGCMSLPFIHELIEFQPEVIVWDNYEVCANEIININIPSEAGVLYEWSIVQGTMASMIDGQYSTSINIQANALAGTFDVVLRRTFCDQFVNETIQVVITPYLTPAFNKIPGICQFETWELEPTNTENIIGTWTWTIGGVSQSFHGLAADAAYDYTFNTTGNIPISLSFVADGCTQEYEIIQVFSINPAPNVSSSYTEVSPAPAIELNATVQDLVLGNYTYNWSVPATGPVVTVPNPTSSNYFVTVVNTTTGCETIDEVIIPSIPSGCRIPEGSITYTLDCNNAVFTRVGYSTLANLFWGFSQNSSTPTYTTSGTYDEICTASFTNAGYYLVRSEEVYANCGHYAELEIVVPLIPNIEVKYQCSGANNIQLELFNFSDYMTDVTINSVTWTIDGIPAVSPVLVSSGSHVVEMEIEYTYNLQTYTCSTSTTVTYLRGDANFITSPGPYCSGSPVQFADNSTNAVSWVYDFNSAYQNLNQNNEQSFEVSGGTAADVEILLTIQDNIGCYDNFVNTISVNPNGLLGQLVADPPPFCSGFEWPANYSFPSGSSPSGYSIYWFPSAQVLDDITVINTNSLLQTGSYYVTLSDNNNCIFQSEFINICFDNTPFAQISGNDVYCPDEVIRLFGESGDYTYLWEGLGGSVYSTANISLPAAALTPGVYSVTLTVSNTNCSSTDVQNVTINPNPPAPTIGFGSNQCLHVPPVNLQSISGQLLYWSTGDYGLSALTFNAGHHLAHYLDPITGCKSEYDTITVVKPPDFNELMTGCFTFCPEDLPKTILPPMGYFDYWEWMMNLTLVQSGTFDIPYGNTLLNISDFGTYNMKIDYPTGCVTMSDDLEIMEEEICDSCQIRLKIREPRCAIRDCEMFLDFTYGFFNMSTGSPAVLTEINILNTTMLSPVLPISIPANTGMDINFSFILESLEPQIIQIEFIFNQNHIFCSRIVTVDLTNILDNCITGNCNGAFVSADINSNLSSSALSYYDFVLQFQTGMTNVQVYSDQVTVFNYGYNSSTGIIDGLFSITPLELQELIDNQEDICFRVYGCRNNVICMTEICFPASELAGGAKSLFFKKPVQESEAQKELYFCSDYSIHPNPAKDIVNITGNDTEFSSAIFMDMTGRTVKTVLKTAVTVSDLNPGDYIVKVISKTGKCQYLKFIKQ
jgi:hypothetical protein